MELKSHQFDYLTKEIEITYSQIDKQRESTTDFLKIYLSIILGLFTFIYFLENRLLVDGKRIPIPNNDFIIFGGFGILVCLITFIIGWALLDNVTKTVYKSIKHYKHISYIRHIIALSFDNDLLTNNSILPMRQKQIPMRISAQVPIIGGLINLALLLLNFYFFSLFANFELSILFTTLIVCGLGIFYANQLEKHFEEILIAQKLLPKRDEVSLKKSVKEFVKLKKQSKNYVYTNRIYKLTLFLFFSSLIAAFINSQTHFLSGFLGNNFMYLPSILFLISLIPRVYMGRHRIEDIKCWE